MLTQSYWQLLQSFLRVSVSQGVTLEHPKITPSFCKVITTTAGILSCLTTAYWASVSLPVTCSVFSALCGRFDRGSSAQIVKVASIQ
jgi:hypothetical protein